MREFLGKLSIAEAMGSLYGKNIRIITTISGFIGASGIIAIQLKIAGSLFEYVLGIQPIYGIAISGIAITLYSLLGGIKSVTLTDVMQFFSFGVIVPTIAYFLFSNLENSKVILDVIKNNPSFDYSIIFSFSNPRIFYYISIFFWAVIPAFNPAIFQRIAMAQNVRQSINAFVIASLLVLLIASFVCWIGILVVTIYPEIESSDILKLIIADYAWISGFKGLVLAGIMAMIMSTVDSFINSSSVLITYDLKESLAIRFKQNELLVTRACSMIIGLISILFAMRSGSFLELFLFASMFYMPIVTVPFIVSVIGFRSSSKSVLIGMLSGFIVAVLWELYFKIGGVGGVLPGMLANLIFLIGYHYLFKQKGGWVGIKDQAAYEEDKVEKKRRFQIWWQEVKSFNLLRSLKQNTPKNEGLTAIFGVFIIVSTFVSIINIPNEARLQYAYLLNIIYPLTLSAATLLIGYPILIQRWRDSNFMAICWNVIIFFILVCSSFLIVLMSDFAVIQLVAFMVNIMMMFALVNWRWSLFYFVLGLCTSMFVYEQYLTPDQASNGIGYKIMYIALLLSSVLIIFLKPKQQYLEATEGRAEELGEKVGYLKKQVEYKKREFENLAQGFDSLEKQFARKAGTLKNKEIYLRNQLKIRNIEISKLKDLKDEFIRNVNHESNTPLTGVLSLCDILHEYYDKLDKNNIKQSIKDIVNSSDRLKTYVNSIADLSKLSALDYELNIKSVNLSNLIRKRPRLYKKLFADDTRQKFRFEIEEDIVVECDEYYITCKTRDLI